jgi:hypothetical protein
MPAHRLVTRVRVPALVWEPMEVTLTRGQQTGDIWHLHAYARPATKYRRASWSVYRHTEKIAYGFATSLGEAKHAAEVIMASAGVA